MIRPDTELGRLSAIGPDDRIHRELEGEVCPDLAARSKNPQRIGHYPFEPAWTTR